MPRLPQVSGAQVAHLLESLGYRFLRQRGSHAWYALTTHVGTHNITIPMHRSVAKGTPQRHPQPCQPLDGRAQIGAHGPAMTKH